MGESDPIRQEFQWFPEMGVPPDRLFLTFLNEIFHYKQQKIGYPDLWKPLNGL